MILRTDSKFPVRRTYVVKLSSDASAEALCGRLENFLSAQHRHFTSAVELLQFITSDLVNEACSPITDRSKTLP